MGERWWPVHNINNIKVNTAVIVTINDYFDWQQQQRFLLFVNYVCTVLYCTSLIAVMLFHDTFNLAQVAAQSFDQEVSVDGIIQIFGHVVAGLHVHTFILLQEPTRAQTK